LFFTNNLPFLETGLCVRSIFGQLYDWLIGGKGYDLVINGGWNGLRGFGVTEGCLKALEPKMEINFLFGFLKNVRFYLRSYDGS